MAKQFGSGNLTVERLTVGAGNPVAGSSLTVSAVAGAGNNAIISKGVLAVNGNTGIAASYGNTIGIVSNDTGSTSRVFFGDGTGWSFALSKRAGSVTTDLFKISDDGGVFLGAATGGDKGAGTINATGIYVNGVALSGSSLSNTGLTSGVLNSTTTLATAISLVIGGTSSNVYQFTAYILFTNSTAANGYKFQITASGSSGALFYDGFVNGAAVASALLVPSNTYSFATVSTVTNVLRIWGSVYGGQTINFLAANNSGATSAITIVGSTVSAVQCI
jgi:hypothetical protein